MDSGFSFLEDVDMRQPTGYFKEFKSDAVKRLLIDGNSTQEVSEQLGVPPQLPRLGFVE